MILEAKNEHDIDKPMSKGAGATRRVRVHLVERVVVQRKRAGRC